ncbi:MAG: DsbA family protein [Candidatus Aenigmarchaeota archaeon]|nr:DsbA family protein [Candidatus Aenigmarchaeota archaeon]
MSEELKGKSKFDVKTLAIGLVVGFVVSYFIFGFGLLGEVDQGTTQPTEQPTAPPPIVDVSADDDAVKGSADAPVTIIEFSDYECPFCARFYTQTYGQIDEKYIQTGKVKYVVRDFPLSFHAQAQKAGEAAECAGEQGQYYEMHDKLFEEGVEGGVTAFKQYAVDLGLDTDEFNTCLDSGAMAQEVKDDMSDGQAAGVTGTPAFFINGKKLIGAQPFSAFEQVIEAELN